MSLKYSSKYRLRFGNQSMKELLNEADAARESDSDIGVVVTHGEDEETVVSLRAIDFLRMVQSGDIKLRNCQQGRAEACARTSSCTSTRGGSIMIHPGLYSVIIDGKATRNLAFNDALAEIRQAFIAGRGKTAIFVRQ